MSLSKLIPCFWQSKSKRTKNSHYRNGTCDWEANFSRKQERSRPHRHSHSPAGVSDADRLHSEPSWTWGWIWSLPCHRLIMHWNIISIKFNNQYESFIYKIDSNWHKILLSFGSYCPLDSIIHWILFSIRFNYSMDYIMYWIL